MSLSVARVAVSINRWRDNIASIGLDAHETYILLENTSHGKYFEQRVALTRTDYNFASKRVWFLCPNCGKRVAIIYGEKYFACRTCWSLSYYARNEKGLDRKFTKARKLRRCLGVETLSPIILKPKGMHHSTFIRLKAEIFRLEYWAWREEGKRIGINSHKPFL